MRVLLFNPQTKLYYGGRTHWVAAPVRARDFHRVQRAVQAAVQRKLGRVEVVLDFESPVSEMALPLSFARRMEQAQFVVSALGGAGLSGNGVGERGRPAYAQAA